MTTFEIISSVSYAMAPEGAQLLVRDNSCQGEPTIRPMNPGGMLLAQAQELERYLQEVLQSHQEVTAVFLQTLHYEVRLYFWRMMDNVPSDTDFLNAVVELNHKTITRLRQIADRLQISYTVSSPAEPLQD